MGREIITTRVAGDAYDVNIKGQHTVRMDQPVAAGGTDSGPNPTDVWVAALGACVAFYAGKYLAAHDLAPEVKVTTTYKMGIGPARVTKIDMKVAAPGITPEHAESFQSAIESCTIQNSLGATPQTVVTQV